MRPQYCCFYLHQQLRIGRVCADGGTHLELMLPDGRQVRQRAANMLYCWEGDPAADAKAAQAQLVAAEAALAGQQAHLDALYARMAPGEPMPFDALVELALGPEATGWGRGLLFAALLRDGLRYRFSKDAFTARSPEEVTERAAEQERRQRQQAWVDKVLAWREQFEAGTWESADDPDVPEFLEQLRSVLALERRSPHWALLSRPLGLHNLHVLDISTRIKSWLQLADGWPGWPDIWLRWGEVPRDFSPEVHSAARPLAAAPVRREDRRDFTADAVYTIDSEGTQDYDDGYSIVAADADGLTIAVHIAEPDPVLVPGHPLFDEALRRMASVYTLEGIFPMFPSVLSTGRFSLVAGEERETLTFILRIEDGWAALHEAVPGVVRVRENLDYGQAERLLHEEPATWGRLADLCASLADVRSAQGAVIMERREAVLDITDPRHIGITQVVRSGPVFKVVEELAILYNREAGRYCRDHRLPGIYRVQPPPRPSGEWQDGPDLPMAARFSTRGAPHAGLACDRYMQCTSPIRRFPDLVMQRQILTHLGQRHAAFPERKTLEEWAERAEGRLATYDEVSRRIGDDWKCRYLLQNRDTAYAGVAQRRWESTHGRVWIEPLHLQAQCVLPSTVKDGDAVRVRVESVDRDHRTVWVTCVE